MTYYITKSKAYTQSISGILQTELCTHHLDQETEYGQPFKAFLFPSLNH